MMVTWDLGRRCNLDCTYCEASRHNNYSSPANLDSLIDTFNFIKKWTGLYNSKRTHRTTTNIDFTGGEPTVNPNFWKLVKHIKETETNFRVGITSNGTWPEKEIDKIITYVQGITISWHAEADESIKKRVLKNILKLKENNIWLQVNVMLHCDYFDEAVQVCDFLEQHNITYNPVPIGDGSIERSGWFIDSDGKTRRTSHPYTEAQQQWFFNKMNIPAEVATSYKEGNNLGRKCCGGRCLVGKVDNEWKPVTLVENKFKDWSCMIDWFFLHIDQETGLVYHHQTCQALHGGKRGAVGNLKESKVMLDELEQRLKTPTNIVCPNQRCGCGMCIPKSKNTVDFKEIWNTHVVP